LRRRPAADRRPRRAAGGAGGPGPRRRGRVRGGRAGRRLSGPPASVSRRGATAKTPGAPRWDHQAAWGRLGRPGVLAVKAGALRADQAGVLCLPRSRARGTTRRRARGGGGEPQAQPFDLSICHAGRFAADALCGPLAPSTLRSSAGGRRPRRTVPLPPLRGGGKSLPRPPPLRTADRRGVTWDLGEVAPDGGGGFGETEIGAAAGELGFQRFCAPGPVLVDEAEIVELGGAAEGDVQLFEEGFPLLVAVVVLVLAPGDAAQRPQQLGLARGDAAGIAH